MPFQYSLLVNNLMNIPTLYARAGSVCCAL
jgi:hypothetical protein